MKPLKLIGILLVAILTSLAMSTGAWAKKGGKPGGGGGNDHGEPQAQFLVELTSGNFSFTPPMTVTRNNRGNGYNSTGTLILDFEQAAWVNVFSTCSIFDTPSSKSLLVSNNWSIDNSGGNQAGNIGSSISIAFRDAVSEDYPEVDIDLYLMGTLPSPGIPEVDEDPIVITLTDFRLFGGAQFGNGCKSSGELSPNSELTMKRTQ